MRGTIAILALAAASACKSSEAPAPAPAPASASGTATGSARPPPPPPSAPVDAATKAPDAAPAHAATLTPDQVTPDHPVSVADLFAAAAAYGEGVKVQIGGYPVFFSGDSEPLGTQVKLTAAPGGTFDDAIVVCALPAAGTAPVKNSDPVILTGTIDTIWPGDHGKTTVNLKDCALVSSGKPFDAATMPVDRLYAVTAGWIGKQLAVTGKYSGVTVSKDPKTGKAIDVRVDLVRTTGDFSQEVGCHLAAEPDKATEDAWTDATAPTTLHGTYKEVVFGNPQLDPCEIRSVE